MPENSRVVFANMLHPDPDMMSLNRFFATNLSAVNGGQPYQRVFCKDQLAKIEVVSKDFVLRNLIYGR